MQAYFKRSPIRKKRTKPRPGRLEGADKDKLRHDCFVRDRGECIDCHRKLVEFPESIFQDDAYHMAHRRNKRMWGDHLDQVDAKCVGCHLIKEHRGGKPVPPKNPAR